MHPTKRESLEIRTRVLLIESDEDRRRTHEVALVMAGYEVSSTPAIPPADELSSADVVLVDVEYFELLPNQFINSDVIVMTDDLKAGITSCLCGAAEWVPVSSNAARLRDAVREVARSGRDDGTVDGSD